MKQAEARKNEGRLCKRIKQRGAISGHRGRDIGQVGLGWRELVAAGAGVDVVVQ